MRKRETLELIRFGCSLRISSANYYLHLIETQRLLRKNVIGVEWVERFAIKITIDRDWSAIAVLQPATSESPDVMGGKPINGVAGVCNAVCIIRKIHLKLIAE